MSEAFLELIRLYGQLNASPVTLAITAGAINFLSALLINMVNKKGRAEDLDGLFGLLVSLA